MASAMDEESQMVLMGHRQSLMDLDTVVSSDPIISNERLVECPSWMAIVYNSMSATLADMESFIYQLHVEQVNIKENFAALVGEYHWVLDRQQDIVKLAMENDNCLLNQTRQQFELFRLGAENFGNHIQSALQLMEKRNEEEFAILRKNLECQVSAFMQLQLYTKQLRNDTGFQFKVNGRHIASLEQNLEQTRLRLKNAEDKHAGSITTLRQTNTLLSRRVAEANRATRELAATLRDRESLWKAEFENFSASVQEKLSKEVDRQLIRRLAKSTTASIGRSMRPEAIPLPASEVDLEEVLGDGYENPPPPPPPEAQKKAGSSKSTSSGTTVSLISEESRPPPQFFPGRGNLHPGNNTRDPQNVLAAAVLASKKKPMKAP